LWCGETAAGDLAFARRVMKEDDAEDGEPQAVQFRNADDDPTVRETASTSRPF
jgi:hypothetical protein